MIGNQDFRKQHERNKGSFYRIEVSLILIFLDMDESIKMAERINQELKRRASKAKRIQRENALKGKFRENHSADPIESPYSQHFRVSSSEKELSLIQKQAELVNHHLTISK